MKKLLFLSFSLLAMHMASAQIDQGLKGYWPFSSGSLSDESGNGNNGSMVEVLQPTADRFGHADCAMQFPGSDIGAHVSIPFSEDFNIAPDGEFSISLWYKGGSEEAGDLEWLFLKQNGGAVNRNYGLALFDANKPVLFGGTYSGVWSPGIPTIPDPEWHHLVGTYSNGTAKLYLDNAFVGDDDSDGMAITQSTLGVAIGMQFQGAIDDVRFYDRELGAADVDLLFHEASACATGITESVATETMRAWPNPASDMLVVTLGADLLNNDGMLSLHDATGRLVWSGVPAKRELRVDVGDFGSGMYFLQVRSGDVIRTQRVVIE